MKIKSLISTFLSALVTLSVFSLSGCSEKQSGYFMYKVNKEELLFEQDNQSYSGYKNIYNGIDDAVNDIVLDSDNVSKAHSGEYLIESNGITYAFIDSNSKWIEWEINIDRDAFFVLEADYITVDGDGNDIVLSLTVDGISPYDEASSLTLFRRFKDMVEGEFEVDVQGNDIRPVKTEMREEIISGFFDDKGYNDEPFGIALSAGNHTIRIENVKNGILLKSLKLKVPESIGTYKDYINQNGDIKNTDSKSIIIEAEHPLYTNSSDIYAVSDWQDVATTPNSPIYTKLNAIGDTNWYRNGQHIVWEFEVEKSGYYAVSMRARQDYSEGMNTYRSVYIDGKIPFEELRSVAFKYDFDWQMVTPAKSDKPYYVWLEKGKHSIALEVNPSAISDVLLKLDELIDDLNLIYRKIVVITGTTVDIYQDYDLDNKIPQLVNSFKDCCNRMRGISAKIQKLNKTQGSIASVLDETAALLDTFIEHPYEISGGLSSYKTNVDDIASLLTNMGKQSLLIDKITLVPKGKELPDNNASFLSKLNFSVRKFVDSYMPDKKSDNKKTVNVWVNTGRDQAQIIKQMISNKYENESDVSIQLNIVDTGATLIQAALADKGPDVALSVPTETPVNLAMRNGLLDLKQFGIDDLYNNFYESAWTQLKYQDGIYGVPETQNFDMLFLRDDIFKEIGLSKVPENWDEFIKCMEVIQNNNLMVGISETNSLTIAVSGGISTFSKFYFQNGGTFFNDNFSKTTFESELAISCMTDVCELYSRYGLDREFDFFNRFRSGEMVMGIAPYSTYNQLIAAAPEINGTWSMYPVPGTKNNGDELNRAESSTGTASIILKAAEDHKVAEESWDFVKWWTETQAQSEFAERLEGVMGVAARYTPANKKVFDSIKWSDEEAEALKTQWQQVYNVREIPGNYYISRSLTSAIRNTITGNNSIRFNMVKYNTAINSEITRKRQEFNLE